MAFSPNSKTIAAAGNRGSVDIWDVGTGKLKRQLTARGPLVFLPNGHFVTGSKLGGNLVEGPVN